MVSGWLPALYQGVEFSSSGNASASFAAHRTAGPVQREGSLLAKLNAEHKRDHPGESGWKPGFKTTN
jgi:hypothetical protein